MAVDSEPKIASHALFLRSGIQWSRSSRKCYPVLSGTLDPGHLKTWTPTPKAIHTLVTTIPPKKNVACVRARAHPGMPTRHRRSTSLLLRDAHATPTPPLCPVPCRLDRSREPQPVVPRAVRR